MIARIEFTAVFAVTGAAVLAYLVVRELRGKPWLPRHPEPLLRSDPSGLMLLGVGLFFGAHSVMTLATGRTLAWGLVSSLVAAAMAIAVANFVFPRLMRPRGSVAGRVGAGLLVVWAALPLVFGVLLLQTLFGLEGEQESIVVVAERRPGWIRIVLVALVVAPLLEEVTFRGLFYPAFRARMGPVGAMVVSGLLFGLVHQLPATILPLTILGVTLAYLVERTGSIVPSIAAHAAFNALTVAQLV